MSLSLFFSDSFRRPDATEKRPKTKERNARLARVRLHSNLHIREGKRGRLSGIGGQKMETQHQLVVNDSPRKQEKEAKSTERSGAEEMRLSAHIVLRQKGRAIVDALADCGIKGHIQCVKLLYDLAERYGVLAQEEETQRCVSLASLWAAEPEWIAQSNEKNAETNGGCREPES